MERRSFLKSSALLAAAGTFNPLQTMGLATAGRPLSFDANAEILIDPIVPLRILASSKKEIIQQIKEINKVYGLRRFLVTAPEKGMKPFPEREVYRQAGEIILEVKQALQGYDIEIGWWCAPSLRSGYADRFQYYVTDLGGNTSENAVCPLDPVFREEFSDNFALVVDIAKPSITEVEDDYLLSWHPPNVNFGCFCSRHLEEFSKREGKTYSREELVTLFSKREEESARLRYKWAELSRDTLADFAGLIRQKVDKVSPETRICLSQASNADFDGDFTEAVVRAFAGNTRPMVRLYGSSYSSDIALRLPIRTFSVLYHRQHLPADIECIHESDAYPHLRFFMSATKLRSLMTIAFAYRVDDAQAYLIRAADNTDNLLEETGYLEMFKKEVSGFSKIKEQVVDAPVVGCEIVHLPFASTAIPYEPSASGRAKRPKLALNPWVHVLGRMGIPYTAQNGKVKAVSGDVLRFLKDNEIEKLLQTAVMLDGYAAFVLSQRGYGKMIGAEVTLDTESDFALGGVSSLERVRDLTKHKHIKTAIMSPFTYVPGSSGGKDFYVLKPEPGAEVITDLIDRNEDPLMPGSLLFENEWGGRVYITAYDLKDNESAGIFNYTKKELIREAIEWLGKEQMPVFVKDLPSIFCICNKSTDGNFLLVTVINLSADKVTSLPLDVPMEWLDADVSQLRSDGKWKKLTYNRSGRTLSFETDFGVMEPVVLKISRKGI